MKYRAMIETMRIDMKSRKTVKNVTLLFVGLGLCYIVFMLVAGSAPVESSALVGTYRLQTPTKEFSLIARTLELKANGIFSYTSINTRNDFLSDKPIIHGRWSVDSPGWRSGPGIHCTPGLTLNNPKSREELRETATYGLDSYFGEVKAINTGIETHDPYWKKIVD